MIKQTLAVESIKVSDIKEIVRVKRASNSDWLSSALADLDIADLSQWSFILLMGGKDIAAFRLRVAQSHMRGDMLPSYWSDCALVDIAGGDLAKARLFRLPILQPEDAIYAPKRNGIVVQSLNKLPLQKDCPNLALLAIPAAPSNILSAIESYQRSRVAYDAVDNILPWLAYTWGSGNALNPLLQQIGFPAAVMLSQVFASESFDLAPGMNSQLSTPEAFWSGIKYWQDFYSKTQQNGLLPKARFVIDHKYDIDER
jgi:hypothetical protein